MENNLVLLQFTGWNVEWKKDEDDDEEEEEMKLRG